MVTNKLKRFAQDARRILMGKVTSRIDYVLAQESAAKREQPRAVAELERAIAGEGRDAVIDRVAYTWFNRFTALQYMDLNGHNPIRIIAPADGQTRPEILAEASAGIFNQDLVSENTSNMVTALLDGRSTSADPETEAYRLLIVSACNYWHGAMPFLFEKIADYTELLMPDDLLSVNSILYKLREAMTAEDCVNVEVIGWLYQFYISEKKDEVFADLKKNKKITADKIPAATQLFTPHWIVRYLVENSLGRLWLLNNPSSKLAQQMDYYIAPEQAETDFLHIKSPEEIKICDPACGSGHMLTYAFDLLYAIYEEAGYDSAEIPDKILTHNLYGIEIDDRAGALAAFALTMRAAGKRKRFLRKPVQPNICVLENVQFNEKELAEYIDEVGKDLFTFELKQTLKQFNDAKNLGSLIVPMLKDVSEVKRRIDEKNFDSNMFMRDVHARVKSVLRMACALSPNYHVVVANPPYMGTNNMNTELKKWTAKLFLRSKADLYAMFIDRIGELVIKGGYFGMITMHGWMFISTYYKLRDYIVKNNTIVSMAHLGTRAFDSIGGEVVSTTAFIQRNVRCDHSLGTYIRLTGANSENTKAELFLLAKKKINRAIRFENITADFGQIPGSPIAYWLSEKARKYFLEGAAFGDYLDVRIGLATGRNDYYLRMHYEVSTKNISFSCSNRNEAKSSDKKWFPFNKGGSLRKWYGNLEYVVNWYNDGKELQTTMHPSGERIWAHNFNLEYIFKPMISWSDITTSGLAVRFYPKGFIFDSTGVSAFDKNSNRLRACIGAICNSKLGTYFSEVINPTHHFTPGDFSRFPVPKDLVDNSHDEKVQCVISIAKTDWDAYETSWDFRKNPLLSFVHCGNTLEKSYNLLSKNWKGMIDEIKQLEEENNFIFIKAYGLQDELTPDVPLEEITLTCNPAYRYGGKKTEEELEALLLADTMREFISYAVGCMFGRYSLDQGGLILADQGDTIETYLRKIPTPTFIPDEDNIIPILDADWFEDDATERFKTFLRITFGDEHFAQNLRFIETAIGKDIRKFFLKDFYDDHVKRYKKRPIYWLFTSPRGSFNALIYIHRYNKDTVSVLLDKYLREFKSKLGAEKAYNEQIGVRTDSTPSEKTRALNHIEKINRVIEELETWERDVIYPLATQRIEIDLDDGVKANYPKFGSALKKITGLDADED